MWTRYCVLCSLDSPEPGLKFSWMLVNIELPNELGFLCFVFLFALLCRAEDRTQDLTHNR